MLTTVSFVITFLPKGVLARTNADREGEPFSITQKQAFESENQLWSQITTGPSNFHSFFGSKLFFSSSQGKRSFSTKKAQIFSEGKTKSSIALFSLHKLVAEWAEERMKGFRIIVQSREPLFLESSNYGLIDAHERALINYPRSNISEMKDPTYFGTGNVLMHPSVLSRVIISAIKYIF